MKKNTFINNGIYGAASVKSASSVESTQWTKYGSNRAQGFSAEDANALYDKLCGNEIDKVGLNNELNGADRIVNGVKIQTKYCQTAADSVKKAFGSDGIYRYPGMKLEVPKGQGRDAVHIMEERIKAGKVPGVTNPSQASDIVVEGRVTYDQAVRISKAGNIDSIKFDVANQMVTCAMVAGLSFVVGYAVSRIGGMSREAAISKAVKQAIQTGATTMVASVAIQQLLRTQVGRTMAAAATESAKKAVDRVMRTPAGAAVIERMMIGILGKSAAQNAARNACIKLARTNYFTSIAIAVATTGPDMVKACRGKKSWKQVGKNAVVNVAGIGTGSAGWWAGAAAGSCLCPGIGTVVGGIIGAIGGGMAGSIGAKKAMDLFVDDDSVHCVKLVEEAIISICNDQNITEEEAGRAMKEIRSRNILRESFFEKMYRAGGSEHDEANMRRYAINTLMPVFIG